MKIKVTQQDIDNGRIGSGCDCPIALAIKDIVGEVHNADLCVGYGRTMVNRKIYKNPTEVSDFIHKFDHNETVQPFEFELRPITY